MAATTTATITTTTTTTTSTPSMKSEILAVPASPPFVQGHQRSRSLLSSDEKSPNDFVFPRKAPTPNATNLTRPRSGTSDATTLLAELGVLPPPAITPSPSRLRAPSTPYYPNRQRPQSMLALPTPPLPSVTLAPAPAGRAHKKDNSDVDGVEKGFSDSTPKEGSSEGEAVTVPKPGPPSGYQRRGHAHRRSGAISSSDVWSLLSQSAPSLPIPAVATSPSPDSAATKPAELKPDSSNAPSHSWSAPVSPAMGIVAIPPPNHTQVDNDRKSSKVAFTDSVEIIPRPLSPASSLGTVHAHGGTDSMSSIADFGTPSMKSPGTPGLARSPTTRSRSSSICSSTSPLSPELQAQFAHIIQRPSTAGAILGTPKARVPLELLPAAPVDPIPQAQPSPQSPETPPPAPTVILPKKTHKKALSDGSPQTTSPSSDMFGKANDQLGDSSPKKKKGGKRRKKHLKNFLFGKGVLSKGGKSTKTGRPLKRSPTPPSRHNSFRKQGELQLPPAWTESYVIMPEGSMAGRSLEELSSTMSPRYPHSVSDRESPVIDLDAALGPFNSPIVGSGGRSSGGFNAAKRRMHSSGAGGKMGIGSGIGMGIAGSSFGAAFIGTHKRSESMPEMPLFALEENSRMEMDDVFEEDEEEEEESSSGSDSGSETDESEVGARRMSTGGIGIGIQVTNGDGITTWEEGISVDWNAVPRGPRRSSLAPTLGSNGSLRNESIQEEDEPEDEAPASRTRLVESMITQDNKSAKSDQVTSSDSCTSLVPSAQSSTSTVTPASAVSPSLQPATPATSYASDPTSVPSTPFNPQSASRRDSLTLKELTALSMQEGIAFDAYADPEFRFLGEPGPEMRMSVDDVPSLTSSSSTMTSTYATYCASGILPSTPRNEESLHVMPVDKHGKPKSLKKKWSKVFKFWENDEKKEKEKEKDKEQAQAIKDKKEKKEKSKTKRKLKEKTKEDIRT
ncbi:hypothetical protein BDZ91DRAFT_135738 [Kalaharituber pfeilii]|nr:hypothetical protein BDZ91DRAFT_135738 [Kalaharituber pfeilii]